MSNEYPQPVEPMSRAEAILRGNETVVPMSRIEDLLKQLIEGGGGGSTISITTEYNTGTKVATFDVDGTDIDLYIPTDQIGSIVSITTDYQDGVKIATLTIDQQDYNIYIPNVSVTPVVQSGTKIATINGTDIFAPADQVGAKTYVGITDPDASLGANGDLYFKGTRATGTQVDFNGTFTLGTGTSSGGGVEIPLDHLIGDAVSLEIVWTKNGNLEKTSTALVEDIPISVGGSMSQGSWHSEGDGNYYLMLVRDAAGKLYARAYTIYKAAWISTITATGPYGDVQTITAGYFKADGAWKKYTTDVAVSQVVSSGVKIATITINDSPVDIYAPEDVIGAKTYKDTTDPSANVGDEGDLYFKLHRSDTQTEHDFTPTWTQSTWNEVDNPYYENFYGYKGTFSFQSSTTTITKTEEEIPIYDTTVQNNPDNYKFWTYSAYKWCAIARSADNKKLYFYDAAGNASYTAQKVITSGDIDGYTDQFIKRGNAWLGKNLPTYSTTEQVVGIWTDGKPLYRRVINSTLITADSEEDTGLTNIDHAHAEAIWVKDSTGANVYIPDYISMYNYQGSGTNYGNLYLDTETHKLAFRNMSRANDLYISAIVLYTKTTD